MGNILLAYNWAVNTCNAPNIGYSQAYRNAQTVGGVTYYDCSSFINFALIHAGFQTPNYAPDHNAFVTTNMGSELVRLGFTQMSPSTTWLKGDILVRSTHTEMVYDGNTRQTMGAHSPNRPLADQVTINTYGSDPSQWTALYRYQGGTLPEWINTNKPLSLSDMENNATVIFFKLSAMGWTLQAISAMLGNMQTESYINPGVWEGFHEGNLSGGYGLTQWTPASKYIDWAGSNWKNPDRQLDRIDWEAEHGQQWFSNPSVSPSSPPITFAEFKRSTGNVSTLANYFLWYYEHPANPHQPKRAEQANYWYNYLSGLTPPGRHVPLWLLFKFRR